jgi:adenosylhomocysteine nucleosidase
MPVIGQIQLKSRRTIQTTKVSFLTRPRESLEGTYEVKASAVILTAQEAEYNALFDHFPDPESIGSHECEDQGFKIGEFPSNGRLWDIFVAKIGPQIDNAIAKTIQAIQCVDPEIILFVGTAGGMDRESLKYGYVIVVEEAYYVDVGEEGTKFRSPKRRRKKRSNKDLIKIARDCIKNQDWKQRIKLKINKNEPEALRGSVGTTAATITSRTNPLFERISKYYPEVVAVEQEGFGFLTGAKQVPAIVIRGVSDFCGEDWETAESAGFKKCAMINASAFAFELLANIK